MKCPRCHPGQRARGGGAAPPNFGVGPELGLVRLLKTTLQVVALLAAAILLTRSFSLARNSWVSFRHPEQFATGPLSVIYPDHSTPIERAAIFSAARKPYIAEQREYSKHLLLLAAYTAATGVTILFLCGIQWRRSYRRGV
jgi:hypothetical protein